MRNFRTAAAASATALALIVSGTTAAVAETTPEADASDRTVLHTGDQSDSIFKGFEQETDKASSEIISDAFEGSSEGVGSSQHRHRTALRRSRRLWQGDQLREYAAVGTHLG